MKSENYSLMNLEKLNIQEEMNYSCDTITTILNISVLGFGICKFDLSDRLCQQGDGMDGPQ